MKKESHGTDNNVGVSHRGKFQRVTITLRSIVRFLNGDRLRERRFD